MEDLNSESYLNNPAKALELITDIQAVLPEKNKVEKKLAELKRLIEQEYLELVAKSDFSDEINFYQQADRLFIEVEEMVYFPFLAAKPIVALAGNSNVGKSEFINSILTNIDLPTDIKETTALPTYISSGDEDMIYSYNIFGRRAKIDSSALQAITKSFYEQYNLSFVNVIKNIVIKRQDIAYNNIVFLDTPSYKQSEIYYTTGKHDKQLAYQYLQGADYLFWLVDITKEEFSKEDIDFIKEFNLAEKVFVVLNKADQKKQAKIETLTEQLKADLIANDITPLGTVAYSAWEAKSYYGDSINNFLARINQESKQVNLVNQFRDLFNKSLNYHWRKRMEQERKIAKLKELYQDTTKLKQKQFIKELVAENKAELDEKKELIKQLKRIFNEIVRLVKRILQIVEISYFDQLEMGQQLLEAVKSSEIDLALDLINSGAKLDIFDQDHQTPLLIAEKNGLTEVVESLIKAGAKIVIKGQEIIKDPVIGSGTEDDPFIISALSGLEKIGQDKYSLDANYKLGRDINAAATAEQDYNSAQGWQPIGLEGDAKQKSFSGVFDGANFKLSNLYLSNQQQSKLGLFSTVAKDGVIKNLNLVDIHIRGNKEVGGLVGNLELGRIENIHLSGEIIGKSKVGGLCGSNKGGQIIASSVAGELRGDQQIGGLVGYNNFYAEIKDSVAKVYLLGKEEVGGLTGRNEGGSEISSSYFAGEIKAKRVVGGISGYNYGIIDATYAAAKILANEVVGGLVGKNELQIGFGRGKISRSYSSGQIKAEREVGGLVAINQEEISNSYSRSNLSGGSIIGGLVATNYGLISYCYATGLLKGADNVGGLAAKNASSDSEIINSYWELEKNNSSKQDDVMGRSTEQLKERATYNNWDFTDIWSMQRDYPYLQWEEKS